MILLVLLAASAGAQVVSGNLGQSNGALRTGLDINIPVWRGLAFARSWHHAGADSGARVAYGVSELFNPQLFPATGLKLVISQEEIARLCGLARQNTHRALHKLEESGLLRIRYGVIEVLDLEGLQNVARNG